MDKRILQTYSVWAKENLEKQVEVSLKTLGINGDKDIKNAKKVGDFTIIDGDPNSYPADLLEKRKHIVALVTKKGYKNVIEELAYTWFNRFVALRFMEVHDFLPHGFHVLSNRSGGVEPEILKNLNLVKAELNLDMNICASLKEQGKTEELFRYVLLRQCSALADILPMLFAKDGDYLELLLPKSLLIGETVLTKLIEIPEDNFLNEVEIIGWMYQFYVADKRQQYREAKTVTKELIPTLTQVFTPDWIVRYMAENSAGRIWMESYPQSSLRSEMKYYVDDPEQTEEVQKKLDAIKNKNVNPEDIRVIEPCCGSGHILVYVFDLLYKMYEEKGHQKRDIPTLILSKNLYGLEIDKRAAQLACFSLVMKARTINPRFFNDAYYVKPQVYEIYDSHALEILAYKQHMTETQVFTAEEIKAVSELVDIFRNGKTVGSLIKVKPMKWELIENVIYKLEHEVVTNVFNSNFVTEGTELLKKLLAQTKVMSSKYDVMITNPPYLGISKMEAKPKEYLIANYPDSKSDMFAMFMEVPFVKQNGFQAIVNPDSWMFLSSFTRLREKLISDKTLVNMVHLGLGAFDAVVQTTTFVFRNMSSKAIGTYYRVVKDDDKESAFLNGIPHYSELQKYLKIPEYPFAYWISKNMLNGFNGRSLYDLAKPRQGLATSDNDRFLKLWHEVRYHKIGFGVQNIDDPRKMKYKWFPCNKGGPFRRWYGNNEYVVDWENDGFKMKQYAAQLYKNYTRTIKNIQMYFQKGLTWSSLSSGLFSLRYVPEGFIFETKGSMCFVPEEKILYVLALYNTKVIQEYLRFLSPTLDYHEGPLGKTPVIYKPSASIDSIANDCLSHAKTDWDSFETSWDFKKHPLIQNKSLLEDAFAAWESECRQRFDTLKANEEELNRIFIEIYGLQDELTPEVEDKDVTVRLADKERDIKSLISYLIGVIMGRYSLDGPGLAFAGGEWDASKYKTYKPDNDGIVPIYSKLGMEDGLTARIIGLIKQIYGEETYRQNMDFIAEALGKNNNESSEETLCRYLNDGFYADHLKIYHKHPIYWMFSSGKYGGFKCLTCMHRYTEDTLALINGKYFLPESTRLKNDMEELLSRISTAEGRDKIRLEKERQKLAAAYNEAIEYGQVLDHMANKYIAIDLDDGVKVNYAKFQGVELVTDSGTKVNKDLLVPIK